MGIGSAADFDVSIIRGDRRLFNAFRNEWSALCDEGPCTWLTYRPEWAECFLASYSPEAEMVFVVVRRKGRIRGLLPLIERKAGIGPVSLRMLTPPANFHTWEFDVIHGEGDQAEVAGAVSAVLDTWRGWDMLMVQSAPADGVWSALFGRSKGVKTTKTMNSWYIPCPPVGTSMLDTIGISCLNRQRQMKRHFKKLESLGNVEWRRTTIADGLDPLLGGIEAFFALEESGWKGREEDVVLADARLREYYRTLGRAGFIVVHSLLLDDRLIASNLGVLDGERFFSLRIAFDEDYSFVSAGHMMTLYTVKDAGDQGCTMVDLGGTNIDMPTYKTTWTEQYYPVAAYTMFPNSTRGRLVAKAWNDLRPSLASHPVTTRARSLLRR